MVAVTVVIVMFGYDFFRGRTDGNDDPSLGTPGNMLAEDYDPYIRYNDGFKTALGITNSGTLTQSGTSIFSGAASFSSTFGIGSTSPTHGDFIVDSSGTTTIRTMTSSATRGSCLEFQSATSGVSYIIYLSDQAGGGRTQMGPFVIDTGVCE